MAILHKSKNGIYCSPSLHEAVQDGHQTCHVRITHATLRANHMGFSNRMHIRTIAFCTAVFLGAGLSQISAASDFPHYWDGREHVAKPNLSTVERIRFVTTVDYPPFNFIDASGRISGFNIDLVRAICSELNVTAICQIEARPWNELQQTVENGEAEAIIAGLKPTAQLREKFAFTAPYMRLPARFVTLKETTLEEPLADKLDKKVVGVVDGSVHQAIFTDYFPRDRWVGYPSTENTRLAGNGIPEGPYDQDFRQSGAVETRGQSHFDVSMQHLPSTESLIFEYYRPSRRVFSVEGTPTA